MNKVLAAGIDELRPYLYLAKVVLLNELAYRLAAFAGFGASIIPMVAMVFVWRAAYDGVTAVAGVTATQMVTYTIISFSIKDVFYCRVQDSMLNAIQNGSIAVEMIRPFHPLGRFLAEDLASSCSALARRFIPLFLFSSLFLQVPLPASMASVFLFVISACASYVLLWALGALVGLLAFWWMELGNFGMVKDAVIRLLSGSIVPLWFFPAYVQELSLYLPFQYTFQVPLSIYIGQTPVNESLKPIGLQVLWAGFFVVLLIFCWGKARRRIVVQGG